MLTGTTADIGPLQKAITAGRNDLRPALAAAYMQKVRETADASYYARAEGVLGTPRTPEAFAVAGELALARHDFTRALALGRPRGSGRRGGARRRAGRARPLPRGRSASCRR